jgi:hypothetical protein
MDNQVASARDVHTNNSLRALSSRGSKAKLSEMVLGLSREGIESRFGRLHASCQQTGQGP